MKKNKNIGIKNIISILIIVLISIIFAIILVKNNYKNQLVISRDEYIIEDDENYLEERIMPRNINILNEYKGNVKRDNLYLKMNSLVDVIEDIKNISDTKKIEDYFNKNKENITNVLGDIDLQDFTEVVKKVNSKEVDVFNYAEIKGENVLNLDNAFAFDLSLNYENEKEINVKIYILKQTTNNMKKDIVFSIIN